VGVRNGKGGTVTVFVRLRPGQAFQGLVEVVAGFGGQGEVDYGAFAWSAGGPDAASVLLDDAAADGQAQAGAAHGSGVGGVALLEAVKDVFELVGGDSAALVFYFDEGFVFVEALGGEMDFAARG
jgi:hypothetical protein